MKKLVLSLLIAAGFVACGEKQIDPNAITGEITMHSSVKSWLKVQKSVLARDERGLGHASLVFANTSSKAQQFYYTIYWYGADGMTIPSVLSAKKLVNMSGYDQKAVLIPAPSDKASSFSLNITPVK